MSSHLAYPGVYIEEIPSGVRTITGVATSITAFVGRCLKGPVNEPITIHNWGDYERIFGGLWQESKLSFAVQDFFMNGGGQAVIVRLFRPGLTGEAKIAPSKKTIKICPKPPENGKSKGNEPIVLSLAAVSEGVWANKIEVELSPAGTNKFSLKITNPTNHITEEFPDLSLEDTAPAEGPSRRVDKVLAAQSKLLRVAQIHMNTLPGKDFIYKEESATDVALSIVKNDKEPREPNFPGSLDKKTGIYALEKTDLFNLLCIPPFDEKDVPATLWTSAVTYCEKRRAFLLVDSPVQWTKDEAKKQALAGLPFNSKNAAIFFPSIKRANPLRENEMETFVPCGMVAGTIARIDANRGLWKAPAGLEANLRGMTEFTVPLTDAENGELNPLGINCLRTMPAAGPVIWGARTLHGNDRLASEWKYIPVRRLALYLEESLYRGLHWAVFEPNDEPLWRQIQLNLDSFMYNLFQKGAFQGSTKNEAYYVQCDKETTTQDDIDKGIVNIWVGFAPLKPAEFVVLKLQQMAGQQAA